MENNRTLGYLNFLRKILKCYQYIIISLNLHYMLVTQTVHPAFMQTQFMRYEQITKLDSLLIINLCLEPWSNAVSLKQTQYSHILCGSIVIV